MGANDVQVGGDHYKVFKHETWDVINDWGLGYFDGNAVKYLSRWRRKGGIDVHAVGDCLAPRRAIDAIWDGFRIGLAV